MDNRVLVRVVALQFLDRRRPSPEDVPALRAYGEDVGWLIVEVDRLRVMADRTGSHHAFAYCLQRSMAYPLTSSRIPSSREYAGRNPVRSIFSLETM